MMIDIRKVIEEMTKDEPKQPELKVNPSATIKLNEINELVLSLINDDCLREDRCLVYKSKIEKLFISKELFGLDSKIYKSSFQQFCSDIDFIYSLFILDKVDFDKEELLPFIKNTLLLISKAYYLYDSHINIFNDNEEIKTKILLHKELFKVCYGNLIKTLIVKGHIKDAINMYLVASNEHKVDVDTFYQLYSLTITDIKLNKHTTPSKYVEFLNYEISKLDYPTLRDLKTLLFRDSDFKQLNMNLDEAIFAYDEFINELVKNKDTLISSKLLSDKLFDEFILNSKYNNYIHHNFKHIISNYHNRLLSPNVDEDNLISEQDQNILSKISDYLNSICNALKDNNNLAKLNTLANEFKHHELRYFDINHYFGFELGLQLFDFLNKCINDSLDAIINQKISERQTVSQSDELKNVREYFDTFHGVYSQDTANKLIPTCVPCYTFHHNTDELLNFIKKNRIIVSSISLGVHLIKTNYGLNARGDFTSFVVAQIKAVERLVKEILVQFFPNDIYNSSNKEFAEIPLYADQPELLTSYNLSHGKNEYDEHGNFLEAMELNKATMALGHALAFDSNHQVDPCKNYHGILINNEPYRYQNNPVKKVMNCDFKHMFVDQVRNGYFHIDVVTTIQDAIKISRVTAYWTMRIIEEMLDILGPKALKEASLSELN